MSTTNVQAVTDAEVQEARTMARNPAPTHIYCTDNTFPSGVGFYCEHCGQHQPVTLPAS